MPKTQQSLRILEESLSFIFVDTQGSVIRMQSPRRAKSLFIHGRGSWKHPKDTCSEINICRHMMKRSDAMIYWLKLIVASTLKRTSKSYVHQDSDVRFQSRDSLSRRKSISGYCLAFKAQTKFWAMFHIQGTSQVQWRVSHPNHRSKSRPRCNLKYSLYPNRVYKTKIQTLGAAFPL